MNDHSGSHQWTYKTCWRFVVYRAIDAQYTHYVYYCLFICIYKYIHISYIRFMRIFMYIHQIVHIISQLNNVGWVFSRPLDTKITRGSITPLKNGGEKTTFREAAPLIFGHFFHTGRPQKITHSVHFQVNGALGPHLNLTSVWWTKSVDMVKYGCFQK